MADQTCEHGLKSLKAAGIADIRNRVRRDGRLDACHDGISSSPLFVMIEGYDAKARTRVKGAEKFWEKSTNL
jgi:hypothetical protein